MSSAPDRFEFEESHSVAWARPGYQVQEVNRAGQVLVGTEDEVHNLASLEAAISVVNNWRSSHSFPLNTFQLGLRRRAPRALVAQRLKRLSSIVRKLKTEPDMKLSQMQDIGGCRAVVESISAVHRLKDSFLKSRIKHKFAKEKDYIATPRDSGYRGVHLVYRYFSDRTHHWDGLKIEIQLRSRLQHAWATSVETVGTMLGEALKASEGSEEWLRFLALTSSAFALLERTPLVPGTPTTKRDLKHMIREMTTRLKVEANLSAYKVALNMTTDPQHAKAAYFLLALNHAERRLRVTSYRKRQIAQANEEYLQAEKRLLNIGSAVLVSVDSVEQLKRAYPNYYQDTDLFLEYLKQVIA